MNLVYKNFLILEEEGAIINLQDIAFAKVMYDANKKKYELKLSFIDSETLEIPYETLKEAEARLHSIFKAIGAMK